jgi:hypothetical protein
MFGASVVGSVSSGRENGALSALKVTFGVLKFMLNFHTTVQINFLKFLVHPRQVYLVNNREVLIRSRCDLSH